MNDVDHIFGLMGKLPSKQVALAGESTGAYVILAGEMGLLVESVTACLKKLFHSMEAGCLSVVFVGVQTDTLAWAYSRLRWCEDPHISGAPVGLLCSDAAWRIDGEHIHHLNPGTIVSQLATMLRRPWMDDSELLWRSRRTSAYLLLRHIEHDRLSAWVESCGSDRRDTLLDLLRAAYQPSGSRDPTQHAWVEDQWDAVRGELQETFHILGPSALEALCITDAMLGCSEYRAAAQSAFNEFVVLCELMDSFRSNHILDDQYFGWTKNVYESGTRLRTHLREIYLPLHPRK